MRLGYAYLGGANGRGLVIYLGNWFFRVRYSFVVKKLFINAGKRKENDNE